MNYNVIIGKSLAYAKEKSGGTALVAHDDFGTASVNLEVGALVIFEYPITATTGGVILTAGDVSASAKEIVILAKYPSDEPAGYSIVKSSPINIANGTLANSTYAAAVAKVISLGKTPTYASGSLNLPGTIEEGQVYELVCLERPILGMRDYAKTRIMEVVGSMDTELTVMTRLVNHFNSIIKYATASLNVSGSTPLGITFTSVVAGNEFTVKGTQSLGYATSNVDTANSIGSGTTALVNKIEFEGLAEAGMGSTYSQGEHTWSEQSMVESAAQYATHVIRHSDPREGEVSSKSTYHQVHKICVPSTGTNPETTLKAILEVYFE